MLCKQKIQFLVVGEQEDMCDGSVSGGPTECVQINQLTVIHFYLYKYLCVCVCTTIPINVLCTVEICI